MSTLNTPRRRFIGIIAATSALALTPAALRRAHATATLPAPTTWRGIALGAGAQLQIHHPDRAHAEKLIQQAVTEVRRLENIFSLYLPDSALVRLNRDGQLNDAPSDLVRLLEESHGYSHITDGAFDPSVQALWRLYAEAITAKTGLPGENALREALQRVDYRAIGIQGRSIELNRPGMALTLNGIAQGYITDRITDLLRDGGLEHALVDMGEIRGLHKNAQYRPWRVGLADDSDARTPLKTIEITNRAVSTSSSRGTMLDPQGKVTHIFDPRSGRSTQRYRSVSVEADNATMADALSTAFSNMDEADIQRVATQKLIRAWVLRQGADAFTQIS